ncbi:MAG: hypothetical protein WC303_02935 [Candidatus Paceibacterota bacterium]|jgi:hypothetical protein
MATKQIYIGYRTTAEEWISSLSENTIKAKQPTPKSQEERFFILKSNQKFLLRITEIRTLFGLPLKNYLDQLGWAENLYKNKKTNITKTNFDKKIQSLLYDFHISQRWKKLVECYVISDSVPKSLIPPALDFYIDKNFNSIIIEINRETTLDDIRENWKEIEKNKHALEVLSETYRTDDGRRILKFKKTKRRVSIKEFKKYKKAFLLKQSGESYKQIAKTLNIHKITYFDVGIFINRFKRIIKENDLY